VYDERDRDNQDPRDGLMHDLNVPPGEERELVVDRDRVYELDGEDKGVDEPVAFLDDANDVDRNALMLVAARRLP
jgi:hypothetical protein